jgi:thiol:disulfide interchange protein DsbA
MQLFVRLLTAAALSLTALGALASPTDPKPGVEYSVLQSPQPVEAGKKVEVTEFFWYTCPHCYAFDPALTEWVKKNAANVVFKRVPGPTQDPRALPSIKMYYALEALGKNEELHPKIFAYVHVERKRLDSDEVVMAFVTRYGIDRAKFTEAYNSFSVQSKVRRAVQLESAYKINQVPTIAIDGRYLTSPADAGKSLPQAQQFSEPALHTAVVQVMDNLVARSLAARNGKK